uniref:putative ubiquitin-like-specific protease 1B n=1 Tax=Erigeron canadensis TaxID=72917 RepID=UPI001CB90678|nr:putative ubiquitin-like-specific protease 1B [Erigeron canadensis]
MGTLSRKDRKRRDPEFQSSSSSNLSPISKRPKSSSSVNPKKNAASRLELYQKNVTLIARGLHAPCRFFRGFIGFSLGIFRKKSCFFSYGNRNALFSEAKESGNASCCKNVVKNDDENVGSESSSCEVVEMEEDGMESVQKLEELDEILAKKKELDQKVLLDSYEDLENGKMLETLSLNRGLDVLDLDVGLPLYKRLKDESAKKHDPSLRSLKFDIELLEAKLKKRQSRPAKKKKDVENEPFKPLTDEEVQMVDNALVYSNRRKALVTHTNSNITITEEVMQCLRPRAWLNDEVINVYLELLKEREIREPKKFLKCHFFNTFFYQKLMNGRTGYDYQSVRRWTTQKKLGYCLLECDKIFVPIHKEIHWCLAVINKKEQKFQYLDSLGGADKKVLGALAKYITDEVKDKTGKNLDVTSWEQELVTDLPNQENGYDCGMFMIKYADFYSRDIGLCFRQEHMPYFRLRTAKEILCLRAE